MLIHPGGPKRLLARTCGFAGFQFARVDPWCEYAEELADACALRVAQNADLERYAQRGRVAVAMWVGFRTIGGSHVSNRMVTERGLKVLRFGCRNLREMTWTKVRLQRDGRGVSKALPLQLCGSRRPRRPEGTRPAKKHATGRQRIACLRRGDRSGV